MATTVWARGWILVIETTQVLLGGLLGKSFLSEFQNKTKQNQMYARGLSLLDVTVSACAAKKCYGCLTNKRTSSTNVDIIREEISTLYGCLMTSLG